MHSLTVDSLKTFISHYESNSLEEYPKSEVDPGYRTIPVMKLVGTTHDQVVYDTEKDVFVFYYVKWCRHCDEFMPIWEDLALNNRYYSKLIFAKINLSENEVLGMQFEHYPTLIYYGRNYKQGVEFYAKPRRDEFDIWIQ